MATLAEEVSGTTEIGLERVNQELHSNQFKINNEQGQACYLQISESGKEGIRIMFQQRKDPEHIAWILHHKYQQQEIGHSFFKLQPTPY